MKKISLMICMGVLALSSCKKEDPVEPTSPTTTQPSYTYQYLTKTGAGAATEGLYWVIDGDTLYLGQCQSTYGTGDYYKSFNFEIGKEYDFKILRGIPPSLTTFQVKNEGTIEFIDGNSSTDLFGGTSSVVINQGATWTYNIVYGQCGSITNQLLVDVP